MKHERIIKKMWNLEGVIGTLEDLVNNMEGKDNPMAPEGESSPISLKQFMDDAAIEILHVQEERVSAVITKLREIFILDEPKSPS